MGRVLSTSSNAQLCRKTKRRAVAPLVTVLKRYSTLLPRAAAEALARTQLLKQAARP
eukprot:CAMPEP_0177783916 /NCGR_PEP_ID=MMETSP0491_2-20121128/19389_1 /TAXON_ID=63592 /ORGANISM="Tetraselmis chuii, Strain PLY429" /LENGTH=56 /DNA_ID=CAMNT_0019304581 /DNA_START=43 /DNA_END=209 /DNA_ORIENTATION=-